MIRGVKISELVLSLLKLPKVKVDLLILVGDLPHLPEFKIELVILH